MLMDQRLRRLEAKDRALRRVGPADAIPAIAAATLSAAAAVLSGEAPVDHPWSNWSREEREAILRRLAVSYGVAGPEDTLQSVFGQIKDALEETVSLDRKPERYRPYAGVSPRCA